MAKHRVVELRNHLEGSVGSIALSGGYLYIYQGDDLLHIASIPSPNLLGERIRDTVVDNIDEFQDLAGNHYTIAIDSSSTGIEWYLESYPDDEAALMTLRYEVKLNEY